MSVLILTVPQEAGNCQNSHYIHRELKYGKGKLICLWKYRKSVAQVEFKHTSAGLVSQSERCVCILFQSLLSASKRIERDLRIGEICFLLNHQIHAFLSNEQEVHMLNALLICLTRNML